MDNLYNYFQIQYLKDTQVNDGYKKSVMSLLFENEMKSELEYLNTRMEYFRFYKDNISKKTEFLTLEKIINDKVQIYNDVIVEYSTYDIPLPIFVNLEIKLRNDPRSFLISQIVEKRHHFSSLRKHKDFMILYKSIENYCHYNDFFYDKNIHLPIFLSLLKTITNKKYENVEKIAKTSFKILCDRKRMCKLSKHFKNIFDLQSFITNLGIIKYFFDLHFYKLDTYTYILTFINNLTEAISIIHKNYVPGIYKNNLIELDLDDEQSVIHSLNTFTNYSEFFPKNSIVSKQKNGKIYCVDIFSKLFVKIQSPDNNSFSRNELLTEFVLSEIIRQKVIFSKFTKNCISLPLALRFDCSYSNSDKTLVEYTKRKYPSCLFYKYIETIHLFDYAKKCEPEELKEIIARILLTLHELYTQVKFTHYDLHFKNILICKNYKNYKDDVFKCYIDDKKYIFKNTYNVIPIICDFGRSRLEYISECIDYPKYVGRCYPHLEKKYLNIDVSKPYPATDIFKILTNAYNITKDEFYENLLIKYFGWSYDECRKYEYLFFNLEYLDKFAWIEYKDIIHEFVEIFVERCDELSDEL
jgi:hypothetical protein